METARDRHFDLTDATRLANSDRAAARILDGCKSGSLGADFAARAQSMIRVDSSDGNTELHSDLDIPVTEAVDEGVDALGRSRSEALRDAVAIHNRDGSTGSSNHSLLLDPAIPITVAPAIRASWTTIDPTPPAAAETATVSPVLRSTARIVAQARESRRRRGTGKQSRAH